MPRKPRIEAIGFHHIINRGVARENIFLKDDDFKKFLEILKIAGHKWRTNSGSQIAGQRFTFN